MGSSPMPTGEVLTPAPLPLEATNRIPHTFRALRHRNFRLFISGQIVSLVGTWMQNVALSWLVYRRTHSELLLGTTWFCSQIAVFALGPLGGLVSDRHSRQKVVILTQTLSMLQAFVLAALTLSGKIQGMYRAAVDRDPTPQELDAAVTFLDKGTLAQVAQALLASNEVIFWP